MFDRRALSWTVACLRGGHGQDAALAASGFTTREGLLKALRRECGEHAADVLDGGPAGTRAA